MLLSLIAGPVLKTHLMLRSRHPKPWQERERGKDRKNLRGRPGEPGTRGWRIKIQRGRRGRLGESSGRSVLDTACLWWFTAAVKGLGPSSKQYMLLMRSRNRVVCDRDQKSHAPKVGESATLEDRMNCRRCQRVTDNLRGFLGAP